LSPETRSFASKATVIAIPARLASSLLPDKPHAAIAGLPMIVQVWRRALEADVGPVLVAAGDQAIVDAVRDHGGEAVMTDPALPSGTDRIRAALREVDAERRYGRVINLQGDLPTIDPQMIRAVLAPLDRLETDMATLATEITDPDERDNPNVVKAVIAFDPLLQDIGRALYFTRATAPAGPGPLYHHIGIYAFHRPALERYAGLPPSPLERRERLEQLRALEHGMTIGVGCVDTVPLGVDTPDQLEQARAILEHRRPAQA
jgi:3-deoxy-manno-octulosonate cytidylyltransferase (CMP-KDO synthetase)